MAKTKPNCRLPNLDSDFDPDRQQTQAAAPRDRVVLASIDYDAQTGVYHSKQIGVDSVKRRQLSESGRWSDKIHLKATNNQLPVTSSSIITIARTTFGPHQAKQIIVRLFYANLFTSIMNTLLLSFLIKSLQLNGQNSLLKSGELVWDERSQSLALNWPVRLESDKFLSVGSIESYQDRLLVISSASDEADRFESVNLENELQSEKSPKRVGEILISAQARPKSSSSSSQAIANQILLPSDNSLNGRRHNARRRPVEVVASSLILNQFAETERVPAQLGPLSSGDMRDFAYTKSQKIADHSFRYMPRPNRHAGGGNDSKRQSTSKSARAHASKRLLELDGQRQSIVVPLLNRIDLFPSSAKTLFVRGEFRCQSTINGRLYENFDLQARWGNLSFESGRTLRIVSRSDKLDLAASRLVSLEAPTLRLSAPKTNKLLISDGIKFFKTDGREAQADEGTIGHTSQSASLEGFKLVLIDDILMASRD